jgi:hypothetical protein
MMKIMLTISKQLKLSLAENLNNLFLHPACKASQAFLKIKWGFSSAG